MSCQRLDKQTGELLGTGDRRSLLCVCRPSHSTTSSHPTPTSLQGTTAHHFMVIPQTSD